MNETEKSTEKIESFILSKIKLPILSTYVIVLLAYNWQIILYLLFVARPMEFKIEYIIEKHHDKYFSNIIIPIIISFAYTLIFPILQVAVNFLFNWFKKINKNLNRQEELDDALHRFHLQQNLTGQQSLERLQANIELLSTENQKLLSDNKNLLSLIKKENERGEGADNFKKTVNQKRIKETEKLASDLFLKFENFSNEEKSAFLDIINYFDSNDKTLSARSISNLSFHSDYSDAAMSILQDSNIITMYNTVEGYYYKTTPLGFEILEYFKEHFSDKL
ncbi:hypothetical protein [Flavobacterium sp. CAU 1735]|uniref:hypothetical protein n=1 Tax=Flavobacterium sp. CAU 1735 TaxID=3140361 RepID=UPI0032600DD6